MKNSLLYHRHNSKSDSYLHPHIFPRNGDHNTASRPLCHFGDVIAMGFKPSQDANLGIRYSLDLRQRPWLFCSWHTLFASTKPS